MSTIQEGTAENFESIVHQEHVSVVYFYVNWSEKCDIFNKTFERVASEFEDVNFCKINSETEHELNQAFGINSVPALLVFRDGLLLYGRPGMADEHTLIQLIHTKRKLNMSEIHEKIASQEQSE